MPPTRRGNVDRCDGRCHYCPDAVAEAGGSTSLSPFGGGAVSPGGRLASANLRGSGRSQSTTAATPGRNNVGNVSTTPGAVQICEHCTQFVATLLVGRRVLCEACAIESGEEEAIPLAGTAPADDIPIDPEWIATWLPRLSLAEVRVYLWLARNSRTDRELPTVRRLMRECCLQRRTVQMSLDKLVGHGLLQRVRSDRNDRMFLIVRCSSAAGPGELARAPAELRPEGRIPAQGAIPIGRGGASRIAPLANPESEGGASTIAPLGGSEPTGEGGVLYSRLRSGRDQTLPLRSLDRGRTQDTPGGGVIRAPHSEPSPSRPSGPSTHPPTLDRCSPDGSPSSSDPVPSAPTGAHSSSTSRGANTSRKAGWTKYRTRVVDDVREQLLQLAAETGTPCSEADVSEYLRKGATEKWLRKRAQQGAIGSPLHFWCDSSRFLRWLVRRQGTNRATRDQNVDAARRATPEERRAMVKQAADLALGIGLYGPDRDRED
jgi:hypothetical protein